MPFLILLALAPLSASATTISPTQLEFFEHKIRPVLSEHCYKCHSEDSEKLKGGLLLDSKAGWGAGGDSGDVIVPGDAANSLLVHMIRREPDYEAMPPKTKLKESEIADIVRWINEGAYDPRDQPLNVAAKKDDFNLEERKQWWSFQPLGEPIPPPVKATDWPSNDYDRFILAALEAKGWSPAQASSKKNLLRRLSFDLIGLAPTPKEMQNFLEDDSPEAYAKQVDRLLASPHLGEKWARHWMDLVRYAETKAFEFDYTMPNAYRYRDYLIKAYNDDVPYNDFVREAIAGDLLEHPRITEEGINESVKGPGFMFLTDGQHGPPDLHEDESRMFTGVIDTTSKAIMGITVACAKCHDHKFDAITAGDYYSMYGLLRSSRLDLANAVTEEKQLTPLPDLKVLKDGVVDLAFQDSRNDVEAVQNFMASAAGFSDSSAYASLQAAHQAKRGKEKDGAKKTKLDKGFQKELDSLAEAFAISNRLDTVTHKAWIDFVYKADQKQRWPALDGLYRKLMGTNTVVKKQNFGAIAVNYPSDFAQWIPSGPAFKGLGRTSLAEPILKVGDEQQVLQSVVGAELPLSGKYSGRITGVLRSPDFVLDGKPIQLYARGKSGRVSLIVRNYEQVGRGPTTKILTTDVDKGLWQKVSIPTKLWEGLPAYIEIIHDGVTPRLIGAHEKQPPEADNAYLIFTTEALPDWESVWADRDPQVVIAALLTAAEAKTLNAAEADVLGALYASGLIRAGADRDPELKSRIAEYQRVHDQIPLPQYVRSLADGTQQDTPIYIRGHHKNLSKDPNPRRYLDAFGGAEMTGEGSGRAQYAEHLVDESNPLVPRVVVNRFWHHLFGRGLVASVDDFGKLGSAPSHPELLDFVARDFIENGWSIKTLLRKLVLTSAYRMSTEPMEEALALDPENLLLQRMPVKRLQAEQIRDHILYCSGKLKSGNAGPSVRAYAGDLPWARGFPGAGTLDGKGWRSVYLQPRRNFMPSFLRTFGMPNATEPIGKRNITNVPAQSLAMLNSQFVHKEAWAWAISLMKEELSHEERIHALHRKAFARDASSEELAWAEDFLKHVAATLSTEGAEADSVRVMKSLCHVMMNRKEFLYLY